MVAPVQTFKVVTEFVFQEAANSSLGTIEDRVEGISIKAKTAIQTVQTLGNQFVLSFLGGGGSV